MKNNETTNINDSRPFAAADVPALLKVLDTPPIVGRDGTLAYTAMHYWAFDEIKDRLNAASNDNKLYADLKSTASILREQLRAAEDEIDRLNSKVEGANHTLRMLANRMEGFDPNDIDAMLGKTWVLK